MIYLGKPCWQPDRALAERLADFHFLTRSEAQALPTLNILSGEGPENCVFEIGLYQFGFAAWIEVTNQLGRLIPREYRFELPWKHLPPEWLSLADAKRPDENFYVFGPGSTYTFAPGDSVNHRLYRKLERGDDFKGFLLGRASGPIPPEFRQYQMVVGKLTIVDTLDREFSAEIVFQIERSRRIKEERKRRQDLKVVGSAVVASGRVA